MQSRNGLLRLYKLLYCYENCYTVIQIILFLSNINGIEQKVTIGVM